MRQAAQIICPDSSLHGARVRPIGINGRCAILLDAHGPHPRLTRVLVPPGMLSDDEKPGQGSVYTAARCTDGSLVMLHAIGSADQTRITAHVPHNGGGTVRGLLQLNAAQYNDNGSVLHTLGPEDPPDLSKSLICMHPVVGGELIIRPADLMRAAAVAADDLKRKLPQTVITSPYTDLDGARCILTGTTREDKRPCDLLRKDRCLNAHGDCMCRAVYREVMLIDDIVACNQLAPIVDWHHVPNSEIHNSGETIWTAPGELAIDHPAPVLICTQCPRPGGSIGKCPAHVPARVV